MPLAVAPQAARMDQGIGQQVGRFPASKPQERTREALRARGRRGLGVRRIARRHEGLRIAPGTDIVW
jgi:hypothetical protein